MILADLVKTGNRYSITYYNLDTRKAYKLKPSVAPDTVEEIYQEFDRELVEGLIGNKLWDTQGFIDKLEAFRDLPYAAKADLVRYKGYIEYLSNYENV